MTYDYLDTADATYSTYTPLTIVNVSAAPAELTESVTCYHTSPTYHF